MWLRRTFISMNECMFCNKKSTDINAFYITDTIYPPAIVLYCNKEACFDEFKKYMCLVYIENNYVILPSILENKKVNIIRTSGDIEEWKMCIGGVYNKQALLIKCYTLDKEKGIYYEDLLGLNPELLHKQFDILSNPINKLIETVPNNNIHALGELKNKAIKNYKLKKDIITRWKTFINDNKVYKLELMNIVKRYWFCPEFKYNGIIYKGKGYLTLLNKYNKPNIINQI